MAGIYRFLTTIMHRRAIRPLRPAGRSGAVISVPYVAANRFFGLPLPGLARAAALAVALTVLMAACSGTIPQELPTATAIEVSEDPTAPIETASPPTEAQAAAPLPDPIATQMPPAPGQEEEMPAIQCTSPADATPAMTEGPFYTPDTPERTSLLEPGMAGARLVVSGYVLTTDCQPIPGAWLDFWQTDANGEYDNAGYRLRGHQFTDEQGRYTLETVLPGEYPGRTQHIHVKVQAPGGDVLTSQLFFPNATGNPGDSIFSPQLVVEMEEADGTFQARFNFILER